MTEEITKIQELINIRIEKLAKLREAGLDPYPHNYSFDNNIEELIENEKNLIK